MLALFVAYVVVGMVVCSWVDRGLALSRGAAHDSIVYTTAIWLHGIGDATRLNHSAHGRGLVGHQSLIL